MIGALILGLSWIVLVQAVTVELPEKSESVKVKRYLTHEHHPCPTAHLHMPMQSIFLKQPYHTPDYSKQIYKVPVINHPQVVHQTYGPWMMEQSIWNSQKVNYAPNYHAIMPAKWSSVPSVNYHVTEANLFKKPGIVYKKDCPPCQQDHQHIQIPVKSVINTAEGHSGGYYNSAPLAHSPIIKTVEHPQPCVK